MVVTIIHLGSISDIRRDPESEQDALAAGERGAYPEIGCGVVEVFVRQD